MPAAKLLSELKSLGVELWPQDGQLKFRAPQGLLDTERLAQLREHKQQILHLLETQERPLVLADPAQRHTPSLSPMCRTPTCWAANRPSATVMWPAMAIWN